MNQMFLCTRIQGTAPFLISPLDGIKSIATSVTSAQGCDVKCTDDSGFQEAVSVAQKAQAVIVVIGLDESQERCVWCCC